MSEELNPEVAPLGALAIGVGMMVAAGIFVWSGASRRVGRGVAIGSFLIAAFTAAAYAEVSSIVRVYLYIGSAGLS